MPELPEVETARQSLLPHLCQQRVARVIVRQKKLRWPVPAALNHQLENAHIQTVARRAKYLLIYTDKGTLIIHLGMSGHLRILQTLQPAGKHDHIDLVLQNGKVVRFTDPRRFGAWLWTSDNPLQHTLLHPLGPEPLTADFNADYLYAQTQRRRSTIKAVIMDAHIVAGIGNIYASEALFLAGIFPQKPANTLSKPECAQLVKAIQRVLQHALKAGGTTIRNFRYGENEGNPGYFKQQLWVYGRGGKPCKKCHTTLQQILLAQRSTFFCPSCQGE